MRRIIGIFLLIASLTACTTTTKQNALSDNSPQTSTARTPKDQTAMLSRLGSFQINGKIAVQSARDSGSATVDWAQNQRAFNISMYGPLGGNSIKISGRPGAVVLETSDGKRYYAATPEQLLAERWGFRLPVSNLRYWIRGMPVPNVAATTHYDSQGRLITLVQSGCTIQYSSYTTIGSFALPDRIAITSPSLKVKLAIHQWKV